MKDSSFKKKITSLILAFVMLCTTVIGGVAVSAEETTQPTFTQDVNGQVYELDEQESKQALAPAETDTPATTDATNVSAQQGTDAQTQPAQQAANEQTPAPEGQAPAEETVPEEPAVPVDTWITFKDNATVRMPFDDSLNYDYETLKQRIIDEAIESNAALTVENTTFQYAVKGWFSTSWYDFGSTRSPLGIGKYQIRLKFAGNETNNPVQVEGTINIEDRAESSVAIKEGSSIVYNIDPNVMKEQLFNNAIDWENSNLPAKETLTVDDFKYEYYATPSSLESLVDILKSMGIDPGSLGKVLVPVEGGTAKVLFIPADFNKMPAGEESVVITYRGNREYRESKSASTIVTVNKADCNVSIKHFVSIYFDENLPEDYITVDPADEFQFITAFVGLDTSANLDIYIKLPDSITGNSFIKLLDPVIKSIMGKSFTEIMEQGITVSEINEILANEKVMDIVDLVGIDKTTVDTVKKVVNTLSGIKPVGNTRINFGVPKNSGLYAAGAVAISKNYNPNIEVGTLTVKMRLSGTNLTWNEGLSGKLTTEEALAYDHGATLTYNGEIVDQGNVKIRFNGITNKLRPYFSSKAPTEPGRYVVTVYTLGGNYHARPLTRTFKIVKS